MKHTVKTARRITPGRIVGAGRAHYRALIFPDGAQVGFAYARSGEGIAVTMEGGQALCIVKNPASRNRFYFVCPQCGRHRGACFRPEDGGPWACRYCHHLAQGRGQAVPNLGRGALSAAQVEDMARASARWAEILRGYRECRN